MQSGEIKIGTWYTTGKGRFRKPIDELYAWAPTSFLRWYEVNEVRRGGKVVGMKAVVWYTPNGPYVNNSPRRSFAKWAVREATPEEAARCEEALR